MAIKLLIFAFHPEAFFRRHAQTLVEYGMQVCGYVSITDDILTVYDEQAPDIILFDIGSVNIRSYANTFECPLLAVSDKFDLMEHATVRRLSCETPDTGLQICGYVENRPEFLVTAINQALSGSNSFYTSEEAPEL
ncbi:MAG: hypothetical protein ACTHMC_17680 [Pseudobacter sp.]|uniref:hypothetical protein n=1 Tax=Pseudobacter sp. TaxID=2045420 RepID=UPI003F7D6B91